ncbi:MAG: pyrimidine 5'-nucleotidase [Anaerolineales bacterium]|nr:pyrimidine 5'-nucleotidase [Anaerolineales bacterium]
MRFTTVFFDLDDTLYPPETNLWQAIKDRMNDYMRERLQIPEADIQHLREKYYLQYGTTTRGLQKHHNIDTEDFLAYVHDIPLQNYLVPNLTQRAVIASLPTRNFVFTNADTSHARRTLTALKLDDLFPNIVDVNAVTPYCKPMRESFEIAMRIAGEDNPSRCVMIDDLARTTRAAHEAGMFSVLYHDQWKVGDADAHFTDWNDLANILENG